METISVKNLDGAYEQCSSLVNHIYGDGVTLLDNLVNIIKNLKRDWIGSDASVHINNLYGVYKDLHSILSEAKGYVCFAGSRRIAMQQVRSANGGSGNIGDYLKSEELASVMLSESEPTDVFDVKPAALSDLEDLKAACEDYSKFMEKFFSVRYELMTNWTAGARREQAQKCFEELAVKSASYRKILTEAKDNLAIAVRNINELHNQ